MKRELPVNIPGNRAQKLRAIIASNVSVSSLRVRQNFYFMRTFIFSTGLVCLIATCFLSSCKKSGDTSDNSVPATGLSYQYQGKTYDGSDGNWGLIFSGTDVIGITINRFDLFGGEVVFRSPDCAYLDPDPESIRVNTGCFLTYNDGTTIDSSVVYLYQSGSFNSTTSNCGQKQVYDIFTGEYVTVHQCDIKGTFDLTLVNNNGDIIEIKNGSFGGRFQL